MGNIDNESRTYCFTMTGFRLVTRLRKDLFDALTVQDMSFFDGKTAEELLTIMSVSCQSMQTALTTSLSLGLRFLFQAVGSTILLLSISWKLTLILFSCVPLFVLGSVVYGHYIRSVEERYQDEGQKQVHETLTHIRSVRALGAEPYVQSRYKLTLQEMYTAGRSVTATHATFMGLTGILPPLSLTLLLYFGLYSLGQGEQSPGSLVSFFLYMLTLILAFGVLGGLYGDIVSGYAAGLQVLKILDRVPCIVLTGSGSGIVKTEWTGRVTLESVSFAYPTRPEVLVLKDINLELAPGSLTVLVGDSGAGKSSILYLIARLYDVAHGRLVMDSKLDVRLASQQWFRPLIGFFLPEEDSFTGKTIYDHILFGYEENIKHLIPQEIVERAAQLANIHSFIMSLPQGYDTRPDRLILSASQKKRLRLARLLIRNPQIVLIDFGNRADEEETDEDREAWRIAIRQISQEQKTVVLVSHDKEILGSADKVVFLSNGSVVESGTHDSLSARQGPYAAFLQGQL